ncbi:MAG: Uma2 family endonuclease, partial [Acidobacteriaceae bacterium]|nr:Uma2 family endonuclease [Acidobacteriaceae bacterium]
EVVSPDDRLPDLVIRASDYLTLGVPVTWIIDQGPDSASFTRSKAQSSLPTRSFVTARLNCRSPNYWRSFRSSKGAVVPR